MRMTRYLFTSTDLTDLAHFEQDLEQAGFVKPQIHVLTEDEAEAQRLRLHQVIPVMKTDFMHSGAIGAALGAGLAVLILLITILSGLDQTLAEGISFAYLAIFVILFCTVLGSFRGIRARNSHTRKFDRFIQAGKHVFFIDNPPGQGEQLKEISQRYPSIEMAGLYRGAPSWLVNSQQNIKDFFTNVFP
ncbi:MAG TPA: hypothetical protein VK110_09920 [Salinisphaeraceae bacterium]|nr:hypothetical protein [Salinisphaeraceae bacterium]